MCHSATERLSRDSSPDGSQCPSSAATLQRGLHSLRGGPGSTAGFTARRHTPPCPQVPRVKDRMPMTGPARGQTAWQSPRRPRVLQGHVTPGKHFQVPAGRAGCPHPHPAACVPRSSCPRSRCPQTAVRRGSSPHRGPWSGGGRPEDTRGPWLGDRSSNSTPSPFGSHAGLRWGSSRTKWSEVSFLTSSTGYKERGRPHSNAWTGGWLGKQPVLRCPPSPGPSRGPLPGLATGPQPRGRQTGVSRPASESLPDGDRDVPAHLRAPSA